ncbi:MAG TPA: hypothetical protein VHV30_08715 [Polyangiaceae bacterium]|jgi:hypothetical protein|nr:hypothetical protein [Polyangiaceae bacterium]
MPAPSPPRRGLGDLLAAPRALLAAGVLAVVVALPALTLGFVTDDYGFRAMLRSRAEAAPAAWDLFRFVPRGADVAAAIAAGHLPWWSAPDLAIRFLRPLTSLLFAADDAVFGDHAVAYHLHSLAWFAALVFAAGAIYRRVLPGPAATVALLVFGLSHANVYPYAWVSARHVLAGAVPAACALWAHVKDREDAWRPGRWLAPVLLAVALAGSEGALAGAAFWIAYDALGPASIRPDGSPSPARLAASAPAIAVAVVYLVVYHLAGGGARSSGGYHDPMAAPLAFAGVALVRVPILLGDALLGIPAELAVVKPEPAVAVAGLVATMVVGLAAWACRDLVTASERAALRWLVPGAIASTLLGVSGFPGGRVLVLPNLGFAALLGVLLVRGFEAGARRGMRAGLAVILAVAHLVLAPLSSWRDVAKLGHRARATEAVARRIEHAAVRHDGRVFLVASDPLVFLYPRAVLAETAPGTLRCAGVLSAARAGHRVTRLRDRTLAFEPIERPLLAGSFDTLFRDPHIAFAEGDTFRQCGASIRVAAVAGGLPTRVEVTFDRPLEDEAILVWQDHHLERLDPPPLGATEDVAWSPGPSGVL